MSKNTIKQGDIFWVNVKNVFPKTSLHYQEGERPCLIVSNDKNNAFSSLVQIIPLTTQEDYLPQHKFIIAKNYKGDIVHKKNYLVTEQLTFIDKQFLGQFYGRIMKGYYKQVNRAIKIQFNIDGEVKYYERSKTNNL